MEKDNKKKDKLEEELKLVECPKCGFKNVKGSRSCGKCHTKFQTNTKSCPKCAKRNKVDAKKCVSCGFDFEKKNHSLLMAVIVTLLFVGALLVIVYNNSWLEKKHIKIVSYIIAGIGLISVIFSTISYGQDEQGLIVAEKEINKRTFNSKKKYTKLPLYIAFVLFILLIAYVLFTLIK